ncbi:unnamed protein product [Brugia timori]|uniref:Uncharacterized protein n=1 Tax=Brugia timori TaxID=42155 RepID=A0A0R3QGZ8_9BILA|nr:unnamed protein product [Brugia timori]
MPELRESERRKRDLSTLIFQEKKKFDAYVQEQGKYGESKKEPNNLLAEKEKTKRYREIYQETVLNKEKT